MGVLVLALEHTWFVRGMIHQDTGHHLCEGGFLSRIENTRERVKQKARYEKHKRR